ncbi:MAG TPA: FeoA domain-containing protein [Candidatus Baltobacteraceae bacterium]|nr:FeoA domain-containing protein [Candidatus Baltobacteraceae bacterium]
MLNSPETCPHGAPIPSDQGRTRERPLRDLDRITPGTRVRIARVREEAGEFLRYLASLGLLPQADLIVEEVAPFGGPLLVRVGDARSAIGRDAAAKILVPDGAVSRRRETSGQRRSGRVGELSSSPSRWRAIPMYRLMLSSTLIDDSGYLNAVAFLTDQLTQKMGLHGRAMIPLVAGAGCIVPAILGTRLLGTMREWIIASTLIVLTPCSARTAVILGAVSLMAG